MEYVAGNGPSPAGAGFKRLLALNIHPDATGDHIAGLLVGVVVFGHNGTGCQLELSHKHFGAVYQDLELNTFGYLLVAC
jgi:hypothetical protein